MRIWLQKQKKKEEAKAAAQATPTPVETPAAAEVQPAGDAADRPVESIEEVSRADGPGIEETPVENAGSAEQRVGSAALQTTEVGLCFSASFSLHSHSYQLRCSGPKLGPALGSLAKMNMIVAVLDSDHGVHFTSPCAIADPCQDSNAPQHGAERRASNASQNVTKSAEPPVTDASTDEQNNANGSNGGMMGNNPMMMNGMSGQMPYGFSNQAGFNNGMYGMNGMPNMMGNGNWNGMNSMGTSLLHAP
jgi:hypothetical protein